MLARTIGLGALLLSAACAANEVATDEAQVLPDKTLPPAAASTTAPPTTTTAPPTTTTTPPAPPVPPSPPGIGYEFGLEPVVAGCATAIDADRELLVRDPSVVDDVNRTRWSGKLDDARDGAWSFGRLMTTMAGNGEPASFVRSWLGRWESDRMVNGFRVAARPNIRKVLDEWPREFWNGRLQLHKAPFRLLAIVNRMDLRNAEKGSAGQTHFVYGVTDNGAPLDFTVTLEMEMRAANRVELDGWAKLWHLLGSLPFGTEAYGATLEQLTDKLTARNAAPGLPNGSAIVRVRTNEGVLGSSWEMREFEIDPQSGALAQSTVAKTPDTSLAGSALLADYVTQRATDILANRNSVPLTYATQPLRGGSGVTPMQGMFWNPPGVANAEARHLFSMHTCNGCHSAETQTPFVHIKPRVAGVASTLSPFLQGTTVRDPVTGSFRTFSDLERRRRAFSNLLCRLSSGSLDDAPILTRTH